MALLGRGFTSNEVLAAYCESMAQRVYNLLQRVGVEQDFVITGGIAKNVGIVKRLERRLGVQARIPDEPQIVGALGAAVFADGLLRKSRQGP
jgi:benzoyl-CoA reductase subunit A